MQNPKIGLSGELEFVVQPEHTLVLSDETPPVLSTPALIWHLESIARQVLKPSLDSTEICVGVHVDVQHLAATPLNGIVVCRARVIQNSGSVISFQVEAFDQHDRIARGLHKRRAVSSAKFARLVEMKRGRPGNSPP